MKNSVLLTKNQKSFWLLLFLFLFSCIHSYGQIFTPSGDPTSTQNICSDPGNQNFSYNQSTWNILLAEVSDASWYKKNGTTYTRVSTNGNYTIQTTPADEGQIITYVLTYRVRILFWTEKREIHYVVSKSMPDIMSGIVVDPTNCNKFNIQFSKQPTSNIRFSWGLGTVPGQNTVQSEVTLAALNINLANNPLGNHQGIWVQKKHVNCAPNEDEILQLSRMSNMHIVTYTCNNGLQLRLGVNGPNTNTYTWRYTDQYNLTHTLATNAGREFNVPVFAIPQGYPYTFFVENATAQVCGNPVRLVVDPKVPQASSITVNRVCDLFRLSANMSTPLPTGQGYIYKWVQLNNGTQNPLSNVAPVYTTVPYVDLPAFNGNRTYRVEIYIEGQENANYVCGSFATLNIHESSNPVSVIATVNNISNSCTVTATVIALQTNSAFVRIKRWESRKYEAGMPWTTLAGQVENSIDVVQLGFVQNDFPRVFRAVYEVLDQNGNVLCETTSPSTNQVNYTTGNNIRYYTGGTFTNSNFTNKQAIFQSNHTFTSNITLCSLTISADKTVTINPNVTVTVTNNVNILPGGKLHISDKGALIQVDEQAVNEINGEFKSTVKSAPVTKFDYTYWSSPVQGYQLSGISPTTLADKFHSFDPNTAAGWVNHLQGLVAMSPGKGYIVRSPQAFSTTVPNTITAAFIGKPNNGAISVPVYRGLAAHNRNNLVGNPYPSSVDIYSFLQYNSSVIEGFVEFWSHRTALSDQTQGSSTYNYSQNDYVVANLTGTTSSYVPHPALGLSMPEPVIATGQSFMVTFNSSAGSTGHVVFKNNMRKSNAGAQFYRYAYASESVQETGNDNEYFELDESKRDRLWLHIAKNANEFKQTLIGYVYGATNENDHYFDAAVKDLSNSVNIYSLTNEEPWTIQGRKWPLDPTDFVSIGYKVNTAGEYTIGLGQFDGVFAEGQNVYLLDRLLGITHDIKASDYVFQSEVGQFDHRFQIRYVNQTLNTERPELVQMVAFAQNQQVHLQAPVAIERIELYDTTGRKVYEKDHINAATFTTNTLPFAQQIMVLTVHFENGKTQTKKIPFN